MKVIALILNLCIAFIVAQNITNWTNSTGNQTENFKELQPQTQNQGPAGIIRLIGGLFKGRPKPATKITKGTKNTSGNHTVVSGIEAVGDKEFIVHPI